MLAPQYKYATNQLIETGGNLAEGIYFDFTDHNPVNLDNLYNSGGRGRTMR
jgi:hypothetical protein